jgi:peptidoglycan L-alanyl-D-glutamate endopeptidase CwlK
LRFGTRHQAGAPRFGIVPIHVDSFPIRSLPDRAVAFWDAGATTVKCRRQGRCRVIAVWVLLLFVALSLAAWLLLFDDARARVAAHLVRWQRAVDGRAARGWTRTASMADASTRQVSAGTGRLLRGVHRHRWWLLGAALLVSLPPLLILTLRQRVQLDSYDATLAPAEDDRILQLLRGERLAPPPPLPPDVFLAAEAELIPGVAVPGTALRPATDTIAPERIGSADRRWEQIHPEFQQRVLALYRVMEEQHGYRMVLVEGFRSAQRQAELAAKGGSVTRAGAGQSCHQYGLAVDSALYRDGKLHWDMRDPWVRRGYFLYGELAQQVGLEWGGSWRSIKDYVHLEWKAPCREARRAARAG